MPIPDPAPLGKAGSAAKAILFLLTVSTALFIWDGTLSASDVKTYPLLIGCLAAGCLIVLGSLSRPSFILRTDPVVILVALFGAVMTAGYLRTGRSSLNAESFYPQICGIAVFLLTISVTRARDVKYFVDAILLLALISSLYAIVQFLGLDPVAWHDRVDRFRVVSFFGNKNVFGLFLILALPLMFHRVRSLESRLSKAAGVAVLLICLAALLLSFSRGAAVCFAANGFTIFLFPFLRKRKIMGRKSPGFGPLLRACNEIT